MAKKGKQSRTKKINPMESKPDYKQGLNYDIQKEIKPDKIKPEKVFEGYSSQSTKKKSNKKGRY